MVRFFKGVLKMLNCLLDTMTDEELELYAKFSTANRMEKDMLLAEVQQNG